MNAPEHKSYGSLSFEERSDYKDLKSNLNIIIREADKGCSVVVMDRQRYIEDVYRQLSNTSVYVRTHASAISDIEEDILRLADQLHIEGVITDDIRKLPFEETPNRLVSTCFNGYIKICTRQTSCFCVRFYH